jgi:hypothetical protein
MFDRGSKPLVFLTKQFRVKSEAKFQVTYEKTMLKTLSAFAAGMILLAFIIACTNTALAASPKKSQGPSIPTKSKSPEKPVPKSTPPPSTPANEVSKIFLVPLVGTSRIKELDWIPSYEPVFDQDGKHIKAVVLRGKLSGNDLPLMLNEKELVPVEADGSFIISVTITSDQTKGLLSTKNAAGQIQEQTFVLEIPDWTPKKPISFLPFLDKELRFGLQKISYNQSGEIASSEINAQLSLEIVYPIKATPWSVGLNGFLTVFAFGDKPPGSKMKFYESGFFLEYNLSKPQSSWKFSLLGGSTWCTATSQSGAGYANVLTADFFPVLEKSLESGAVLSTQVQFSPIVNVGSINLDNYLLNLVLSYHFKPFTKGGFFQGKSLGLHLNYTKLNLDFTGTFASSQAIGLGAGLLF